MSSVGQKLSVVVCSDVHIGSAGGQIAGPIATDICPAGQSIFVVQSFVPLTSSEAIFENSMAPFDNQVAAGLFSFGFGIVVFFFILGLKGSVLIKPFWGGRY